MKLVVLSGAGISAESGISTFRDSDGLWEKHRIEDVATPEAWNKDPDLVNRFYNLRRRQIQAAAPNAAHIGLAELENEFDVHIITQNIDDLHERGGSSNIIHLHGEILKMRCERDPGDVRGIEADMTSEHISKRGFRMRPHIVWFGESVPEMVRAAEITEKADVIVVIGTSLNVYPAAGLLHYAGSGVPVFMIDKKLPDYGFLPHVTAIEKPATAGILDLKILLEKLIISK